jgi:putative ABC transport system permease protein
VILLRLISWPYFRKHVLRTLLTTAGIVLGIAVFVAMQTANRSVLFAFSQTIDRIAGKADLQVTAGEAGFGEEILDKVQAASTVQVAVPVIEAVVDSKLQSQGNLLVLGVDMTGDRSLRQYDLEGGEDAVVDDPLIFLAQPDSLIVSKDFADRNHLANGSHMALTSGDGEKPFTIRGIMKSTGLMTAFGGNLIIMDVYAAQKMFGRGRTFDRIDLAIKPGTTLADSERELTSLLGPGFEVQPSATRGQQAEAMLAGYAVMVRISSAFALFIGMFIIYNSFTIAVTQRRSEIGILRALGASRRQIQWLFLGESAVLGLVGSIAGLVVGILVSRAFASAIGGLASTMYGVAEQTSEVATSPDVLGLAVALGLVTSVIAAAVPAGAAARVNPIQALQKGRFQLFSATEGRVRVILAIVGAVLALACLTVSNSRPIFYAGYGFTIAVGLILCPILSLALAKIIRPAMKWLRPVEGALAADSLIQAPRRTSASVAALMLSLALIVAFAGIAQAAYGSVTDWLNTALNPDLFVMPSARLDLRTSRFPATMAGEIAAIPGVGRVQMFRNSRITLRQKPAMVVAIEISKVEQTDRRRPVAGNREEMFRKAAAGEGVILADNLAQLQGWRLGDVIDIPAPYGAVRLPIVGIVVDYTDQQGSVLMDRSVFLQHWHDDSVSDFRIYAAPGADPHDIRQRIIERYAGKRQLFVLTNGESRTYVLGVAAQWFGLMNVQVAVAVLVAIFGIVNTLTVSITDRRRELGVMQALGALRNQIRRTIWIEAIGISVLGLVLGYLLGGFSLYYMLQIVQRDVAGLRLDYRYPVSAALAVVPMIVAAAFVAALWPAERAIRGSLAEALEYE